MEHQCRPITPQEIRIQVLLKRFENFYFHFVFGVFPMWITGSASLPVNVRSSFQEKILDTVMRNHVRFCSLLLRIRISWLWENLEKRCLPIFLFHPTIMVSLYFQRSPVCKITDELNEVICGKVRLWMIVVFLILLIIAIIILTLFLCSGEIPVYVLCVPCLTRLHLSYKGRQSLFLCDKQKKTFWNIYKWKLKLYNVNVLIQPLSFSFLYSHMSHYSLFSCAQLSMKTQMRTLTRPCLTFHYTWTEVSSFPIWSSQRNF